MAVLRDKKLIIDAMVGQFKAAKRASRTPGTVSTSNTMAKPFRQPMIGCPHSIQ